MPDVELARLPQGFAEAVNARALADVEPTLRFYDRDHLPPNPTVPYGVVDYTVTEIPWDPTLDRGIPSGTAAVIVTGVGDRRANALWVLDTVRRLIARIDPTAAITLAGTTRVSCVWSASTPSPPVEVGDLVTSTETYYVHVEAT
jgi:hypothetical protein